MKLIKNKEVEQGSEQCRDITEKGSRCSRDAVKRGFCKQHYRLRKDKGLIVETYGTQVIQQIPKPPEGLGPMGSRHFQIYCRFLIDQDRLYQIYLPGITELCYLEEQLEEVKDMIQVHGAINTYDSGPQVSGYSTRYKDVLRDIRNLRRDYGLTSASEIVATNTNKGNSSANAPKQGYESGKAKGW